MTRYRKWFCNCKGSLRELVYDPHVEEDSLVPTCPFVEQLLLLIRAIPSVIPNMRIPLTSRQDPFLHG